MAAEGGPGYHGVGTSDGQRLVSHRPIHEGRQAVEAHQRVGDHVARRLFRQAKQALNAGGELRVIGNRHLGYHKLLGKLFGKVGVVFKGSGFYRTDSRSGSVSSGSGASSEAAKMIQMCDNCRINAQYHAQNNPLAGKERPRVRTSEDYFSKRKDH